MSLSCLPAPAELPHSISVSEEVRIVWTIELSWCLAVSDFSLGAGDKREGEWDDIPWNVGAEPFKQDCMDLGPLEAFPLFLKAQAWSRLPGLSYDCPMLIFVLWFLP